MSTAPPAIDRDAHSGGCPAADRASRRRSSVDPVVLEIVVFSVIGTNFPRWRMRSRSCV